MTNDDLKRFYNVNEKPEQNKDFVRYGSNGEIISEHDATKDEEVVNYRTLMQHASGGTSGSLYRHTIVWSQGSADEYYSILYTNSPTVYTTQSFKDEYNGNNNIPLYRPGVVSVTGQANKLLVNDTRLKVSVNGIYLNREFLLFTIENGTIKIEKGISVEPNQSIKTDTVVQIL